MAATSENSDLCSTLASRLPGQVSYAQDAAYGASISSYFYQQARLSPRCIVFPKGTSDVSLIVKTIAEMRAKAAVRGGGHTPNANAANDDNAVTIDLSGMNAVSIGTAYTLGLPSFQLETGSPSGLLSSSAASCGPSVSNNPAPSDYDYSLSPLSPDAAKIPPNAPKILSAGGGATWGDVYRNLESTGLISIGGRGTSLGVGGLTTGGLVLPLSYPPCLICQD